MKFFVYMCLALIPSLMNGMEESYIREYHPFDLTHLIPLIKKESEACESCFSPKPFDIANTFFIRQDRDITDWKSSTQFNTLVCIVGSKPVGFVSYKIETTKVFCFDILKVGTIHLLAVKHKYRNKGYGTALMKAALDELEDQDVKSVLLACKISNQAMVKMCKRSTQAKSLQDQSYMLFTLQLQS